MSATNGATGIARVVTDVDDAIMRLEPDDILVVRATSPAFNVVLPLAAAIVTEHGGAMSHAAIVARELGVPAIVGVKDATRRIRDGERIHVDPSVRAGRRRRCAACAEERDPLVDRPVKNAENAPDDCDHTKGRAPFAPWDRRELPGIFSVEESARRVGNYKWAEMRLFEVLGGWVATVPELDVKLVLGRHT